MLRHPRVKKLHQDRTWRDCITFDELQCAAAAALDTPQDSETQENVRWIARLESSHKRRFARHSLITTPRPSVANTTPRSARSDSTCTPQTGSVSRVKPLATLGTGSRTRVIQETHITPSKQYPPLPTPPEGSGKSSTVLGKRKSPENRVDGRKVLSLKSRNAPQQREGQHAGENPGLMPRAPLADITQQIARKSSMSDRLETYRPSWIEGHCKFGQPRSLAQKDTCILSQSVVFLAGLPEAEKEQVTRKVLEHGAVIIQDLGYWDRDSHAEHGNDCVAESQAYKGLRKMVLVDPRETLQCRACYAKIERLKLHIVEIFDYRLVKAMCSNAEAS
jgi:DNA ligase-4